LELTALLELLDDVGAAYELALHKDLRDRRPTGDRRQLLPDRRIRQDVDRRHRRPGATQRLQRTVGVPAHDDRRRALHEEGDVGAVDDFPDLVGVAHVAPLVSIRSSWIVPSASGVDSASYTRRCCSTSESPVNDGAETTTWKWSPPPVRSMTSSSVASGNAPSSSRRRGSVLRGSVLTHRS